MKWLRTVLLFDKGEVAASSDWRSIHESYVRSIQSIDHPEGTGRLVLRRKARGPDGKLMRNGVKYLRMRFLKHLVNVENWEPETTANLREGRPPTDFLLFPGMQVHNEPITSVFGGFDFFTTAPNGTEVAIEWETGNVSSSHRSLNKLAIALETNKIQAGVLIVPSRLLYHHLTDRIGSIEELSGYLAMWKSLGNSVQRGLLAISVVEHDELSDDPGLSYLPLGEDGRAREGRARH